MTDKTIKVYLSISSVSEFVEVITNDTFSSLEDRTKFVRSVLRKMKYTLPTCSIKDLKVVDFRPSQISQFENLPYPTQVWYVEPNEKYINEYDYPF